MMILYHLGVSSISSKNGREESISSVMGKNRFSRGNYRQWWKHANPDK